MTFTMLSSPVIPSTTTKTQPILPLNLDDLRCPRPVQLANEPDISTTKPSTNWPQLSNYLPSLPQNNDWLLDSSSSSGQGESHRSAGESPKPPDPRHVGFADAFGGEFYGESNGDLVSTGHAAIFGNSWFSWDSLRGKNGGVKRDSIMDGAVLPFRFNSREGSKMGEGEEENGIERRNWFMRWFEKAKGSVVTTARTYLDVVDNVPTTCLDDRF